MFIEFDDFLQMTPYASQLYTYLSFQQSTTMGQTKPLKKSEIADDLNTSRSHIDKRLEVLVDLGFIDVIETAPLVIRFVNVRLNKLLEASDVSEAFEPDDDDGPGEYEAGTPLDY